MCLDKNVVLLDWWVTFLKSWESECLAQRKLKFTANDQFPHWSLQSCVALVTCVCHNGTAVQSYWLSSWLCTWKEEKYHAEVTGGNRFVHVRIEVFCIDKLTKLVFGIKKIQEYLLALLIGQKGILLATPHPNHRRGSLFYTIYKLYNSTNKSLLVQRHYVY